jgi:hypothetical protein
MYFETKKDFLYLDDKYEELDDGSVMSEDFEEAFTLESK